MKKEILTPEQIESYKMQFFKLSNSAQYKKARNLAFALMKKYPHILLFQYYEAIYSAEDPRGLAISEIKNNYKITSKKLKRILFKLNGSPEDFRGKVRNEYYWFTQQNLKQYKLGVELENKYGNRGLYSQGVGASMIALKYARSQKWSLANRWAKKSETAWLKYFKITPNWYNSYLFYAQSLGILGKNKEMMNAFKKAAKLSGLSIKDDIIQEFVKNVESLKMK